MNKLFLTLLFLSLAHLTVQQYGPLGATLAAPAPPVAGPKSAALIDAPMVIIDDIAPVAEIMPAVLQVMPIKYVDKGCVGCKFILVNSSNVVHVIEYNTKQIFKVYLADSSGYSARIGFTTALSSIGSVFSDGRSSLFVVDSRNATFNILDIQSPGTYVSGTLYSGDFINVDSTSRYLHVFNYEDKFGAIWCETAIVISTSGKKYTTRMFLNYYDKKTGKSKWSLSRPLYQTTTEVPLSAVGIKSLIFDEELVVYFQLQSLSGSILQRRQHEKVWKAVYDLDGFEFESPEVIYRLEPSLLLQDSTYLIKDVIAVGGTYGLISQYYLEFLGPIIGAETLVIRLRDSTASKALIHTSYITPNTANARYEGAIPLDEDRFALFFKRKVGSRYDLYYKIGSIGQITSDLSEERLAAKGINDVEVLHFGNEIYIVVPVEKDGSTTYSVLKVKSTI